MLAAADPVNSRHAVIIGLNNSSIVTKVFSLLTSPDACDKPESRRYAVLLVAQDFKIRIIDVLVLSASDVATTVNNATWLEGCNILAIVDFNDKHLAPF